MASKTGDAISMLLADHREVQEMFKDFEGLGDRAIVGKKRLADKICKALAVHLRLEEDLFYPEVRDADAALEDLVDESIVEHAGARDLIAQIEAMQPDEPLFDARVKVLSEQIEHHIRDEEKELIPHVKKLKLDLADLGERLAEHKKALEAEDSLIPPMRRDPAAESRPRQ